MIRHVEDNLVRQSVRDIWEGKIRGNYGLHQASAVKALVVVDDDAFTDWAIGKLETFTGCGPNDGGLGVRRGGMGPRAGQFPLPGRGLVRGGDRLLGGMLDTVYVGY